MNREQQTFTMSSREIAHLCENRHDNILRDIEKIIQDIGDLRFEAVDFEKQYQDAKGEWRKEYRLPKDLTITLITGYCADLRYRVVKRLAELESQSRPAILSGPQRMAAALIEADVIPSTANNRLSRCRAARLLTSARSATTISCVISRRCYKISTTPDLGELILKQRTKTRKGNSAKNTASPKT
jgi:phage regulator Rha-like protein